MTKESIAAWSATVAEGPHPPARSGTWRRHYVLLMMIAIYTVNYVDRSIISVLAQLIKADLQLSDTDIGVLGGLAFVLLYATMGLPFARLAERRSRVNLICVALSVWSIMTALCGLAGTFWQLFLARFGVGIGEAGCNPTAQSMIADIYPPERRSTALAAYSLGVPIGTLIGAMLGGWIGQQFGWRYAFILVGLPGLLLALVVRLTVREPLRGAQDSASEMAGEPPSLLAVSRLLWRSPTFRHITAGFVVCSSAFYAFGSFMVAYVLRAFDVSLIEVSFVFGLVSGLTGFVGLLLGGLLADWLGKRDKRAYGWIPAAAQIVAAPLLVLAMAQRDLILMTVLFIAPATLCLTYLGPGYAVVHNLVAPRMRATAVAILVMITTLVGMSLGPPSVGMLSDFVSHRIFVGDFDATCRAASSVTERCRAAQAGGLRAALMGASLLYVWSAVHFLLAGRAYATEAASRD
jgi:predicted MFS family arabinose efflux permease